MSTAAPSTCAACGEAASTTLALQECKACKSVAYCNRTCQRAHWKQHKQRCQTMKEERIAALLFQQGFCFGDTSTQSLRRHVTLEEMWAVCLRMEGIDGEEAVGALVAAGADLEEASGGATPLYLASRTGVYDMVCLLVRLGAQLDSQASEPGLTAVYTAAYNGQIKVVS